MIPRSVVAWGIAVLLTLSPTYLVRFAVGPLHSTMLEVSFGVLVVLWLVSRPDWSRLHALRVHHQTLSYAVLALLAAATVSVFVAPSMHVSAGLWKAYFFEPVLFFIMIVTTLRTREEVARCVTALSITAALVGVVAVVQYFWLPDGIFGLWHIPNLYWREAATRRTVSVFEYPNAIGLFVAPLLPLFFWRIVEHWRAREQSLWRHLGAVVWYTFVLLLCGVAILLAHSSGAIAGVGATVFVAALVHPHTRWLMVGMVLAAAIALPFTPAWRPFADEFLLQGYSGKIRVQMWKETLQQLETAPILGNGLGGYQQAVAPYHKFQWAEIYLYPHDIFLNFWTEIGAVGMIAFAVVLLWCAVQGAATRDALSLAAAASVLVIVVHGLVDVPYFKNDLAMIFWFVVASLVVEARQKQPDRIQ